MRQMNPAVRQAAWSAVEQLEYRCLLSTSLDRGLWIIRGDDRPASPADSIVVELDPAIAGQLRASLNGLVAGRVPLSQVRRVLILAGAGNDTVTVDLPANTGLRIRVYGGKGNDTLSGSSAGDYLAGGEGNDVLVGGTGDDSLFGCWGDDQLDGGADDDLLVGGRGSDLVVAQAGDDLVKGQGGHDSISGGLGRDSLWAGTGRDQINGAYDRDWIDAGPDADTLWGGDGRDTLISGTGADTLYFEKHRDRISTDRSDLLIREQRVNRLQRLTEPEQLKQWLIEQTVQQWQWALGQKGTWYHWWYDGLLYRGMSGPEVMAPGPEDSNSGPDSYSQTNTQEQGVDEADLVKTDGKYLYKIHGNRLLILDCWPAGRTHIVSETATEGYPSGLYLLGDRLIVISTVYTYEDARLKEPRFLEPEGRFICPWYCRGRAQVQVSIFDVSDRENPRLIEQSRLDGSLSESRLIDGRLYLVTNGWPELPEPLRFTRQPVPDDPVLLKGAGPVEFEYETEEAYRARLQSMSLEELLPGYSTTIADAAGQSTTATGGLARVPDIYVPDGQPTRYEWNMFSVALLDLNDAQPGVDASTTIVGMSGQVYASAENLYVAAQRWDVPLGSWRGETITDIYKFGLGTDAVPLLAMGQVPGWTINQFAMDEQDDYFRIATTSSTTDGTANNVFVLAESNLPETEADAGVNDLVVTGEITGLAFSERIYSARFVGDRGYLVTFRQIDPLFTLDMADPENPTVVGELKIPGYSAYLHPFEYGQRSFVIGVGRDATEDGRVRGVQVSLFDVTSLAEPKQLGVYKFSNTDGWNWTAAEWDHHAFSYFPEYRILALPMVTCGYGADGSGGGLEVLRLDPDASSPDQVIIRLGTVEHRQQPQRSLRIGAFLYSVGDDAVKVVKLEDPGRLVADVEMPPIGYDDGPVWPVLWRGGPIAIL